MPKISRDEYTAKEREKHDAAYYQLQKMIFSGAPDAGKFKRTLKEERAAGFSIDFYGPGGWTLLLLAVGKPEAILAGLPQMLIDAGADVNIKDKNGEPPLGRACWDFIYDAAPEYLQAVNTLLAAGARPELDRGWIEGECTAPDQQARRGWLEAYIASWAERRAAAGPADTPAFDYAL